MRGPSPEDRNNRASMFCFCFAAALILCVFTASAGSPAGLEPSGQKVTDYCYSYQDQLQPDKLLLDPLLSLCLAESLATTPPLVQPAGSGKSFDNHPVHPNSGANASDRTLWKGKTVLLDAGHGGHDPGAVRLGIREKDITLQMVLYLKKVLEARGARVFLTRHDDKVDLELADICKIIDKIKPDVFLSIHVNSSPNNQKTHGIQTYFRENCSRMLGHTMHVMLVQELHANDLGVFTCHFWVLNNPNIPSLLIETGYITNKPDRRNLITPSYQHKFCQAIANGLERYWAKKRSGKTS